LISCPGFPDPFAVATIGGEQTKTTSVIKKTLNPYWNEVFDMSVKAASRQANRLTKPQESV
jgi:Ca2+-dependent lipid-binding protein